MRGSKSRRGKDTQQRDVFFFGKQVFRIWFWSWFDLGIRVWGPAEDAKREAKQHLSSISFQSSS